MTLTKQLKASCPPTLHPLFLLPIKALEFGLSLYLDRWLKRKDLGCKAQLPAVCWPMGPIQPMLRTWTTSPHPRHVPKAKGTVLKATACLTGPPREQHCAATPVTQQVHISELLVAVQQVLLLFFGIPLHLNLTIHSLFLCATAFPTFLL